MSHAVKKASIVACYNQPEGVKLSVRKLKSRCIINNKECEETNRSPGSINPIFRKMVGVNISPPKICTEEKNAGAIIMMETPFPKSVSFAKKYSRLMEIGKTSDALGILINADPDSMASAMALKRLFWKKARRVLIYRVNSIERADNLAFVKFLAVDQKHIRYLKRSSIRKWALVDSQPHHHKLFMDHQYNIIIDHHPVTDPIRADFLDIQEDYGANSSIMTEYLRAGKIKPSPKLATALFYGIKTDTHNFVRASIPHDMDAFKYLYRFINLRILKKIESSEMTRDMLAKYRQAIERLIFIEDIAFVHMERVGNPDLLVLIADFFWKTYWTIQKTNPALLI